MNAATESIPTPAHGNRADLILVLARWVLGGVFIYMGLHKVMDPVEFIKLIRLYHVVSTPVVLNFIAITLPWFEVFCGLLLLTGIAVRGTALLLVAMLIPFTLAILRRALEVAATGHLPFCAVKFDCGCGSGEVLICGKLIENTALVLVAIWILSRSDHRFGLRPSLLKSA